MVTLLLAAFLTVVLVVTLSPAVAFADTVETVEAGSTSSAVTTNSTTSSTLTAGSTTTSATTSTKATKKKLTKWERLARARKKKGRPLIAVVNLTTANCGSLITMLRRGGCDVKFVSSKNINVKKYDGLAIPGGGDVTPSLYKATRKSQTYGTSLKRDRLQIAAIKKFAKAEKPILGICRGAQILNVAFGGTLNQHITGWHTRSRYVKIKKGSWLYKTYGKRAVVYHYHHQCVKKLGKGLVATQWDTRDKRIEAFEHTDLPVYGIQWHPDHMGGKGAKVANKFRKACLKRM